MVTTASSVQQSDSANSPAGSMFFPKQCVHTYGKCKGWVRFSARSDLRISFAPARTRVLFSTAQAWCKVWSVPYRGRLTRCLCTFSDMKCISHGNGGLKYDSAWQVQRIRHMRLESLEALHFIWQGQ